MSCEPTPLPTHCKGCGKPFEKGECLMLCDVVTEDVAWHADCFEQTPCGKGEHGEGCPTAVFE